MILRLALLAVLPGAACTAPLPLSMAQAEAQCARAARSGGSGTSVTLGLGGTVGGTGVGLITDLPQSPRDPVAAYNACVTRKSGMAPITPFADRPELKG